MTPDELKAAWREQRGYHLAVPGYRNGYRLLALRHDEWRVTFWLEDGRAMARDEWTKSAPVIVEEGPDLAADLAVSKT